jgi:flagellar hook-basal body complex protein FliE
MGRDVSLTDTVMAVQKSSIAFEATLQIRNKVIKAYDEIKNMPI